MKLVPYSEKVFLALFALQQDDETRKEMGGLSVPMTEEESVFAYAQFQNGNNAVLGVSTEEDDLIGAFIMSQIQPRHKRLDFNYVFKKEFKQHTEPAFSLFMDFIFNEKNIDWVHIYVSTTNLEQCLMIEKLGFLKRCTIPEYFNFSDGISSANMYSLHKLKRKDK